MFPCCPSLCTAINCLKSCFTPCKHVQNRSKPTGEGSWSCCPAAVSVSCRYNHHCRGGARPRYCRSQACRSLWRPSSKHLRMPSYTNQRRPPSVSRENECLNSNSSSLLATPAGAQGMPAGRQAQVGRPAAWRVRGVGHAGFDLLPAFVYALHTLIPGLLHQSQHGLGDSGGVTPQPPRLRQHRGRAPCRA
jgi:hypothetical protein